MILNNFFRSSYLFLNFFGERKKKYFALIKDYKKDEII